MSEVQSYTVKMLWSKIIIIINPFNSEYEICNVYELSINTICKKKTKSDTATYLEYNVNLMSSF